MIYLTRKEHFNAAHRLSNATWSEEKNLDVFGKCANKNWHGHNYTLYITVKGVPDALTGFVINAKNLSELVNTEVIQRFDHKNLNLDTDFFKEIQPSTENFAKIIWQLIYPHITTCKLHCIKLVETENIYVEYYGD